MVCKRDVIGLRAVYRIISRSSGCKLVNRTKMCAWTAIGYLVFNKAFPVKINKKNVNLRCT